MIQRPIRFGLHDFLNAQPLLAPLSGEDLPEEFVIELDTPAALAERLDAGELDLAMIPAVAFFTGGRNYRLLDKVCIASCGKVDTVLFAVKAPLASLKTIAVDRRSKTSIALLKILFADRFAPEVSFVPHDPDPLAMLRSHAAGLIIGDQALAVPRDQTGLQVFDLSEAWFEKTGLPFVHAVIAVRKGVSLSQKLQERIVAAPEQGLKRMQRYLKPYADKRGLDAAVCEHYLKKRILYRLDTKEKEGVLLFQKLCVERGLVPEMTPIEFY